MFKKWLAGILVTMMVVQPLSYALAEEVDNHILEEDVDSVVEENVTAIASGKCGDNLTYAVTGNEADGYVITISGTGAMYGEQYYDDEKFPWTSYLKNAKLVLNEGITLIACEAFACNRNSHFDDGIEWNPGWRGVHGNLIIPNTVTDIEAWTFADCSFSDIVYIPGSVKKIGQGAFDNAILNGRLILNEGIEQIRREAFEFCSFKGDIIIPSTLQADDSYYTDCGFQNTYIDGDVIINGTTKIPDRMFYSADIKGNLYFSEGVETIGYQAFKFSACNGDIVIPNSVKIIEAEAFAWQKNYGEIKLGDGIEEVQSHAFEKPFVGDVVLPANIKNYDEFFPTCLYDKTSALEVNASGNYSLYLAPLFQCITYRGNNNQVKNDLDGEDVSSYGFYWGDSNGQIASDFTNGTVYRNSVSIIDKGKCGENLNWEIKNDGDKGFILTIKGTGDMYDYDGSDSYDHFGDYNEWGDNLPEWFEKGYSQYYYTKVIVEEGVTSIGDHAFAFSNICDIKLPSSLKRIGKGAFARCQHITGELNLPEGLEYIDYCAFLHSTFHGNITIPKSVKRVEAGALRLGAGFEDYGYSGFFVNELVIEDGVGYISSYAFNDNIKNNGDYKRNYFSGTLTIPASVYTSTDGSDWYGKYEGFEISTDGFDKIINNSNSVNIALGDDYIDENRNIVKTGGKGTYYNLKHCNPYESDEPIDSELVPTPFPKPTGTPKPTPTLAPTVTPTPGVTVTPTPTPVPTVVPEPSPTVTATPTVEATATPISEAAPIVITTNESNNLIMDDGAKIEISSVDKSKLLVKGKSGTYDASTGTFKAIKKGTAKLYYLDGKKKVVVCTIKVEQPKLKASLKMKAGKTKKLKLSGTKRTDAVWSSSDESVASMSGGIVTAKKAGECDIIAKIGKHEWKCHVIVK